MQCNTSNSFVTCLPVIFREAGEAGVLPVDEGDGLGLARESDSPGARHFLVMTPHVRVAAQSAVNTTFVLWEKAYCRAACIASCQLSTTTSLRALPDCAVQVPS